jgi:hypothetical protein
MKVFISWSGPRSQAVAQTLRTWLKDVMQAVDPWISSENIRKGTRWSIELARELETTHIGVICLTPENLTAPWLLFEAGALSKVHTEQNAHVCTYLIGMPYAAVTGPFTEFQHTSATQEDTYRMVQSINAAMEEGPGRLTEDHLKRTFERCWSELQQCLETLPEPQEPIPPPRKTDDMLQEVLEIVRSLVKPAPRSTLPIDLLQQIIARLRSTPNLRSLTSQEGEQMAQKLTEFGLHLRQIQQETAQSTLELDQTGSLLSELGQWLSGARGNEPEKVIIPEASMPLRRKKQTSKGRHPHQRKPRA